MKENNLRRVSAIIPVYNAGRYLQKCVESVLTQDVCFDEIILVNDGSTDDSFQIMEHLKKENPEVIKIYDTPNRGAAMARQFGLDKCSCEFVMFIDADDTISPDYLKTYVDALEDGVEVVMTGDCNRIFTGEECVNYLLNKTSLWGMVRKLYSRDVFLKVGPECLQVPSGIRIGEDILANMRVLKNVKKIKTIPYDGYIDGDNVESVTRSRDWSLEYEKLLLDNIVKELGGCIDRGQFWIRQLRVYRALTLNSTERYSDLSEFLREIRCKKPQNIEIGFADKVFLYFGNPRILRNLYRLFKRVSG